jgi:uncharacterized membrane protein (UPF0127 family)
VSQIAVISDPTGAVAVCERCVLAYSPLTRMRGLLGRRELAAGDGLLLRPAGSIHTHFMRFAIDAVFLDRDDRVLHVRHAMKPWRAARRRGAKSVLELRAGEAARRNIQIGDVLRPYPGKEATDVAG